MSLLDAADNKPVGKSDNDMIRISEVTWRKKQGEGLERQSEQGLWRPCWGSSEKEQLLNPAEIWMTGGEPADPDLERWRLRSPGSGQHGDNSGQWFQAKTGGQPHPGSNWERGRFRDGSMDHNPHVPQAWAVLMRKTCRSGIPSPKLFPSISPGVEALDSDCEREIMTHAFAERSFNTNRNRNKQTKHCGFTKTTTGICVHDEGSFC